MSRYELISIKNPSRKLIMGHMKTVPTFFLDCYNLDDPMDPNEPEVPNESELFHHDVMTRSLNYLLQMGETFLGEEISYEVGAAMREDMRKFLGQTPYCPEAARMIKTVLKQEKQVAHAMPD